ncbi:hypothetical protein [uncultured Hyphomicrobium sp.]|nr:hypothetical protein [uncultured Hyphomicrobium sp.]
MQDHAIYGVRFYTRIKTVTARWPTGIRSGADVVQGYMSEAFTH